MQLINNKYVNCPFQNILLCTHSWEVSLTNHPALHPDITSSLWVLTSFLFSALSFLVSLQPSWGEVLPLPHGAVCLSPWLLKKKQKQGVSPYTLKVMDVVS